MNRRGLHIVILGPDGSGKSTLANALRILLTAVGIQVHIRHLGPRLLRNEAHSPVTDPHARPPRGVAASVVKLGYWWIDYTIGYIVTCWPLLRRGDVIVHDRYLHDVAIDPKRYRYGGPLYLARLLARVVPQPDIFFILVADPETILARKAEVSESELYRQLAAYRTFGTTNLRARVLDANLSTSELLEQAAAAIACSRHD